MAGTKILCIYLKKSVIIRFPEGLENTPFINFLLDQGLNQGPLGQESNVLMIAQ